MKGKGGITARGYTQSIINSNKNAKSETEGVKLGRICIKYMYPVALVAKRLHTSRQGIYDWFSGKSKPNQANRIAINKLIEELIAKDMFYTIDGIPVSKYEEELEQQKEEAVEVEQPDLFNNQ